MCRTKTCTHTSLGGSWRVSSFSVPNAPQHLSCLRFNPGLNSIIIQAYGWSCVERFPAWIVDAGFDQRFNPRGSRDPMSPWVFTYSMSKVNPCFDFEVVPARGNVPGHTSCWIQPGDIHVILVCFFRVPIQGREHLPAAFVSPWWIGAGMGERCCGEEEMICLIRSLRSFNKGNRADARVDAYVNGVGSWALALVARVACT